MENIRNCPSCKSEICYSNLSLFRRAENKGSLCKKCANTKKWKDPLSQAKASDSRKKYLAGLSDEKKKEIFKKTSEKNKEIYLNRSDEWKKEWSKICSTTSKERWEDPVYKERLKKTLSDNNWSKREDSKEIKDRQVKSRIKNNGGIYHKGPGRCKEFLVHGLKCYGSSEKKYIEILLGENQKLPSNTEISIETEYGTYTPDFEFDDFYVEVKSTFTYAVLIGEKSYSKNRESNPNQLKKIQWVSENLKKVMVALIDGEILNYISV
jgi:hypothetical protein